MIGQPQLVFPRAAVAIKVFSTLITLYIALLFIADIKKSTQYHIGKAHDRPCRVSTGARDRPSLSNRRAQ